MSTRGPSPGRLARARRAHDRHAPVPDRAARSIGSLRPCQAPWLFAGPASTTSRTSRSTCPATGSSCSRGCRARASRRSPSTPSTPRASGATSSRCRAYARQFLGQMDKPDVDFIEGLSPGHLHRPEVGVAQPPFDGRDRHRDLRLPAPALRPHRPAPLPQLRPPGRPPEPPADRRPHPGDLPEGTRFQVLAPVVRGRKGEYAALLDDLAKQGFARVRVDGELIELSDRGHARAGPLREAHHRGGGRPARPPRRHPSAG